MAETVVIDFGLPEETGEKNQSVKRKRDNQISLVADVAGDREAKIRDLNGELQSLINYFKELGSENGVSTFTESHLASCSSSNVNAMIAVLLEEKSASYSKLSSQIFEILKERGSTVTVASVKSNIIYIGRRVCYGLRIDEGDVLEDESESCLWCWETRDMKLIPTDLRGALKIRRTCRKKINERITAISALLSLLQNPNPMDCRSYGNDLRKASDKLSKVLSEADIRLVAETSKKNDGSEIAEKGTKREEKLLIKQLEKVKREEEKEKKRLDRERQKEKLQNEKDLKRLQEEADREAKRREKEDVKRREKEESEMRKQLKRKQEEVEKDQRRREKEEAEQKKQRTIQKQASVMERFLKLSKENSASCDDQTSCNATTFDVSNRSDDKHQSTTHLMDCALLQKDAVDIKEIRKSHVDSWHSLAQFTRHGNRKHWGTRQKPKTAFIKELKLSDIKGSEQDDEMRIGSLTGRWEETSMDDKGYDTKLSSDTRKSRQSRQLLQFDKSNRPAFYGVWPKKSHVVGLRCPFKKDPELDYDIDSDEEWEEEEPGESLSECEKDEDENLEEGFSKAEDEDESEDGFFVPDGYLSENEGVENDRRPCINEDDAGLSPSSKPGADSEEFSIWFRQLKHLHNLTDHALRKNQPHIISIMHENAHLLSSDNLTGTLKVEQMCLQALAMRPFPDGLIVEVPSEDILRNEEDQETCTPSRKSCMLSAGSSTSTQDFDLQKMVSVIQSCPYGMNKVLDSLLKKFPKTPKAQLRNIVRQISDFVDNRWQVKKEILVKLGLPITPEKRVARAPSIATFFSKRCMPPSGNSPVPSKSSPSPEASQKPASSNSDSQQPTGQRLF